MPSRNVFRNVERFVVRFLALIVLALVAIRLVLYVGIWVQDGFTLVVEQIRSDSIGIFFLLILTLVFVTILFVGPKLAGLSSVRPSAEAANQVRSQPGETIHHR